MCGSMSSRLAKPMTRPKKSQFSADCHSVTAHWDYMDKAFSLFFEIGVHQMFDQTHYTNTYCVYANYILTIESILI